MVLHNPHGYDSRVYQASPKCAKELALEHFDALDRSHELSSYTPLLCLTLATRLLASAFILDTPRWH